MRVVGAGVVCYARDCGDVWVLLGREKETPGWRMGSNRWSAFSGKIDADEDLVVAATREFKEETLSVVPLTRPDQKRQGGDTEEAEAYEFRRPGRVNVYKRNHKETDAQAVSALRSALTLESVFNNRNEICRHVTFLAEVQFDDYPRLFSELRRDLLKADGVFGLYHKKMKLYLDRVPGCFIPGTHLSSQLVVRDVRLLQDRSVEVDIWSTEECACSRHVFLVGADVFEDVGNLSSCWRELVRFVDDNRLRSKSGGGHPAVRISAVRGTVSNAHVDKAYMEKSEIKWWSLNELKNVCRNKGQFRDDFRPHFLEFLHFVVSSLESLTSASAQKQPSSDAGTCEATGGTEGSQMLRSCSETAACASPPRPHAHTHSEEGVVFPSGG